MIDRLHVCNQMTSDLSSMVRSQLRWSPTYHNFQDLSGGRSQRTLVLLGDQDPSSLDFPQQVTCGGNTLINDPDQWLLVTLPIDPSALGELHSYPEFSPSPRTSWFRWQSAVGMSWRWGWAETRGAAQAASTNERTGNYTLEPGVSNTWFAGHFRAVNPFESGPQLDSENE